MASLEKIQNSLKHVSLEKPDGPLSQDKLSEPVSLEKPTDLSDFAGGKVDSLKGERGSPSHEDHGGASSPAGQSDPALLVDSPFGPDASGEPPAEPGSTARIFLMSFLAVLGLLVFFIIIGNKKAPTEPFAANQAGKGSLAPSTKVLTDPPSSEMAAKAKPSELELAAVSASGKAAEAVLAPSSPVDAAISAMEGRSRLSPGGQGFGAMEAADALPAYPPPPQEAGAPPYFEGGKPASHQADGIALAQSDPDSYRLWIGLALVMNAYGSEMSRPKPAPSSSSGSMMPTLPPNQSELPISWGDATLDISQDAVEVWAAVLRARQPMLAQRPSSEAGKKASGPLMEWTLGELARLDPDGEVVGLLNPGTLKEVAAVLNKGRIVTRDEALAARWLSRVDGLRDASARPEPSLEAQKPKRSHLVLLEPESDAVGQLDPDVINDVGSALFDGADGPPNVALAIRWYSRAAELGSHKAQFNLSKIYDLGQGVPRNRAKANRFYIQAAEGGFARAGLNLCINYHRGYGVEKNQKEAVRWCAMAAEQGNSEAQLFMGDAYYYGSGVQTDKAKAVFWYSEAAKQDNANALFELGSAFEKGEGAWKDQEMAYACYEKAAMLGSEKAQARLEARRR